MTGTEGDRIRFILGFLKNFFFSQDRTGRHAGNKLGQTWTQAPGMAFWWLCCQLRQVSECVVSKHAHQKKKRNGFQPWKYQTSFFFLSGCFCIRKTVSPFIGVSANLKQSHPTDHEQPTSSAFPPVLTAKKIHKKSRLFFFLPSD